MTETIENPALATPLAPPRPVTVAEIVAVVDELAVTSSPTPASMIVRIGLLTELRAELRPSLGQTSGGRGSGAARIPIDAGAIAIWEDVTARVLALYEDLEGEAARTGSVEQVIIGWSRDLIAADLEVRARQETAGIEPTGLSQDTLRLMLHRVNRIRDRIVRHFDPGRSGDIPGEACPVCGKPTALVEEDGEQLQMPALGWTIRGGEGMTVTCRNPDCATTWRGADELELLQLQRRLFATLHHTPES